MTLRPCGVASSGFYKYLQIAASDGADLRKLACIGEGSGSVAAVLGADKRCEKIFYNSLHPDSAFVEGKKAQFMPAALASSVAREELVHLKASLLFNNDLVSDQGVRVVSSLLSGSHPLRPPYCAVAIRFFDRWGRDLVPGGGADRNQQEVFGARRTKRDSWEEKWRAGEVLCVLSKIWIVVYCSNVKWLEHDDNFNRLSSLVCGLEHFLESSDWLIFFQRGWKQKTREMLVTKCLVQVGYNML